jgi:signal transduction histidine kinase
MRTANNTNNYTVEGLVAKYRNFVKENTPKYTTYIAPWEDEEGGEVEWPESDIDASSDQQLIVALYSTVAGKKADKEVLSVLSEYLEHYYLDVLNADEFAFLCEHFSEVIEFEFNHKSEWFACSHVYLEDRYEKIEDLIKERVLFEEGQTVFIPDAGYCDLAILFKGCVVKGYTSTRNRRDKEMNIVWALGQIRLYAAGIKSEIVPYINMNEDEKGVHQVSNSNLVDLIVCLSFINSYNKLYDLLKKGGQMYVFSKRDDLVDYSAYKKFRYKKSGKEIDDTEAKAALERKKFLSKLIETRAIHSLVSYFDKDTVFDFYIDFVLLKIEKKRHSTVVVESINRGVAAEVNSSVLDANLLWPGYYMANRPKDGKPLSALVKLFNTEDEVVEQYWVRKDNGIKLSGDLLVLSPRNFGDKYSDACMSKKDLEKFSNPMFEHWDTHMICLNRPCVCLSGNHEKLVVGYIIEDPTNKYVGIDIVPHLTPKRNIDVRYIAAILLSPEVKQQIITICDGSITTETISLILNRIIVPNHTLKERLHFLAEANYLAMMSSQQELKKNHEDYKKAVRMRKHALTQSLSSIEAMFYALDAYRLRQNGNLSDADVISRRKGTTVKEAFEFIEPNLKNMMVTLEHIADVEYSFDNPQMIDPERFIEAYVAQKESGWLNFKPIINWKKGNNQFGNDVRDPETGSMIAYADDPISVLYFSKDAFKRVLDNVVANAIAHGFTDSSRNDYKLRFSWHTDGMNLVVVVENNGTAIPADRDTASLLEYGVSGALHHDGHNGIGCNEIDDIMRRYDGSVEIVSTPNEEYTVKYVLRFKSNSNSISFKDLGI